MVKKKKDNQIGKSQQNKTYFKNVLSFDDRIFSFRISLKKWKTQNNDKKWQNAGSKLLLQQQQIIFLGLDVTSYLVTSSSGDNDFINEEQTKQISV